MKPPIPADESRRLAVLNGYHILDTEPEEAFDAVARLVFAFAALGSDVPGSMLAIIPRCRHHTAPPRTSE
jgi:hypothetical protein